MRGEAYYLATCYDGDDLAKSIDLFVEQTRDMPETKRSREGTHTVSKKTKMDTNIACSSSSRPTDKWYEKSLAETNLHMLENKLMCDVTFLVGEEREPVKAHKYMLVSRNPVFHKMFCGPSPSDNQFPITFPDVEADSLKIIIRFIYTADVDFELTMETVMALSYAAQKFKVGYLQKKCLNYLHNNINEDNVCRILQQAIATGEETLIEKCSSYVFNHGEKVLGTQSFLLIDKETLRRILVSDDLRGDEVSIYHACLDWAKYQLSGDSEESTDQAVRKRLGQLIYLIRFPLMCPKDFTVHVSKTNILTDAEKVAVFQSNILKGDSDGPFICRERFNGV